MKLDRSKIMQVRDLIDMSALAQRKVSALGSRLGWNPTRNNEQ